MFMARIMVILEHIPMGLGLFPLEAVVVAMGEEGVEVPLSLSLLRRISACAIGAKLLKRPRGNRWSKWSFCH